MKLAVVCNPATVDDPEDLRTSLKRHVTTSEVPWFETTEADPGAGQTRQALAAGAELVLVCGGDGTVAACAGVLAGTEVPMGLLPTGTGNLLVRNLGLPLDVPTALDRALSGRPRTIDLLESDGRRFAVMAGLGFDAALIRDTGEQAKKRHGWSPTCSAACGHCETRHAPTTRYASTIARRAGSARWACWSATWANCRAGWRSCLMPTRRTACSTSSCWHHTAGGASWCWPGGSCGADRTRGHRPRSRAGGASRSVPIAQCPSSLTATTSANGKP